MSQEILVLLCRELCTEGGAPSSSDCLSEINYLAPLLFSQLVKLFFCVHSLSIILFSCCGLIPFLAIVACHLGKIDKFSLLVCLLASWWPCPALFRFWLPWCLEGKLWFSLCLLFSVVKFHFYGEKIVCQKADSRIRHHGVSANSVGM